MISHTCTRSHGSRGLCVYGVAVSVVGGFRCCCPFYGYGALFYEKEFVEAPLWTFFLCIIGLKVL